MFVYFVDLLSRLSGYQIYHKILEVIIQNHIYYLVKKIQTF